MRVLMVTDFPNPNEFPRGGVEVTVLNLVKALGPILKRNGGALKVLSFWDKPYEEECILPWGILKKVPRRGSTIINLLYRDAQAVRKESKVFKADIVHAQGCSSWLCGVKCPTVVTIHGIVEDAEVVDNNTSNLRHRIKLFIHKALENRGRKKSSKIIAINDYVIKRIKKFSSKMILIENAISDYNDKNRKNSGRHNIVYVGRIIPRKNILWLLGLLNEVVKNGSMNGTKIQFWYPNETDYQWYLKECMEYAKNNSLENYVEWKGPIDDIGLENVYSSALVSLLPSVKETAPMSIAESLSLGVPCIANDVGGVGSMIEHRITGSVLRVNDQLGYVNELLFWMNLDNAMSSETVQDLMKRWNPSEIAIQTYNEYCKLIVE